MNLAAVIELSASMLGLYSGVFFCAGVLDVKNSTIEIIATSFYGSGFTLAKELVQQKSDFIFGAGFLFLSFLAQVVGKLLSPEVGATVVASSQWFGVAIGFGGPTIVLLLIYIPHRLHRAKSERNLNAAVDGKV